MAVEVSFSAECSRDGLLELRERIDELLGRLPEAESLSPREVQVLAANKVTELHRRLGEVSWQYLVACANSPEEGFDFERIAHSPPFKDDVEAMTVATVVKGLKASHRNIGRSEKQVDDSLGPGAPPLFERHKRRDGTWYTMPRLIREAILAEERA